jgi:hypothetical protein
VQVLAGPLFPDSFASFLATLASQHMASLFSNIIQGNASKETTFFGEDTIPYLFSSSDLTAIVMAVIGIGLSLLKVLSSTTIAAQCTFLAIYIGLTFYSHFRIVRTEEYINGVTKGVEAEQKPSWALVKHSFKRIKWTTIGMFVVFSTCNLVYPVIICEISPASIQKDQWNNLNTFYGSGIFVLSSFFIFKRMPKILLTACFVYLFATSGLMIYVYLGGEWIRQESWYIYCIIGANGFQSFLQGVLMSYLIARTIETSDDRVSLFILNSGMNYGYLVGTSLTVMITAYKASISTNN